MKKLFTLSLVITAFAATLLTGSSAKAQSACQANFNYSIGTVTPNGATVSLYDSSWSAGTIIGWNWSFGNGTGSNQQNPVVPFNPGTYYVCLTITAMVQNQTCTSTYCDTLVISTGGQPCNAGFSYSSGLLGVQFASNGSNLTSWAWDFGDGSTSNLANPVHAYANPGTYTVCLLVTNASGNSCTQCQVVVVPGSTSCNAGFSWFEDSTGVVHFINTSTGGGYNYWNFGNGQTSNQTNPSVTFNGPGMYYVCLTIYDSLQSCTSTYCDTIFYQTSSGGCSATFGYQVSPNGVYFNGSTQNNVSWVWDFGDGFSGTGSTVVHGYSAPGAYVVCLTVATANGLTCTSCQTINIQNTFGCSSNFAIYPDTNIAHTYYLVNLASGVNPITYTWSWGDGTSSTGAYPSHTYAFGGLYTICLTITDAAGCTSNTCYQFQLLRLSSGSTPVTINVVPGSVGIQEALAPATVNVSPNPASSLITASFTLNESAVVSVRLINVAGQAVYLTEPQVYSTGSQKIIIDISALPKGLYVLEMDSNGQKSHSKVLVQ